MTKTSLNFVYLYQSLVSPQNIRTKHGRHVLRIKELVNVLHTMIRNFRDIDGALTSVENVRSLVFSLQKNCNVSDNLR